MWTKSDNAMRRNKDQRKRRNDEEKKAQEEKARELAIEMERARLRESGPSKKKSKKKQDNEAIGSSKFEVAGGESGWALFVSRGGRTSGGNARRKQVRGSENHVRERDVEE